MDEVAILDAHDCWGPEVVTFGTVVGEEDVEYRHPTRVRRLSPLPYDKQLSVVVHRIVAPRHS